MRKLLAIFLAGLMLFGLLACGSDSTTSSTPESQTTTTATTVTTGGDVGGASSTTAGRNPSTTTVGTSGVTTTRQEVTDWEKPVTSNTAILYNEKHSSYDGEAEKMRLAIVNAKSVVTASTAANKTYYISPKGNDANDGLSPATAWRTLDKLYLTGRFKSGDVVLLERGAVYRGHMALTSGVSYGAYGTGAKPAIYGSPQNYADPALWTKTERENVWRLTVEPSIGDVGNIVFDHGKVCASDFKQVKNTLTEEFAFHHDDVHGYIYLYLSAGNPGDLYDSVEICPKEHVLSSSATDGSLSNVAIDNLCIKYGGAHGIGIGTAENITITNCEVGYIGGSMQSSSVRYGNGIEFWGHATNIVVKNNWIYQCYDAGYTNQGDGARHTDLLIKDNLIEYCNYNIEIFGSAVRADGSIKGLLKNCVYEGNVLRFAGYGFGTNNRIGSNDSVTSAICYWRGKIPSENVVIRNNVLDTSYRFLLVAAYVNDQYELAPKVTGNTWIQHNGPKSAVALQVDTDEQGWNNHARYELKSKDLAQMTTSVHAIDLAPKKILHDGK